MTLPKIVREGITLVGGNAWAQAITLLAYLVLGRLYSPEDFALFNIFYSYIEILIILSTCKYELAVVVAQDDREAMAVARLALRMNAVVSALIIGVVWLLPMPTAVALMVPPMVFFCGTTRVYSYLFNRFRQFGPIAVSEMVTSTAGVLAKIALTLSAALHSLGLPLGTVLGKAAGNVNYLARLRRLRLPQGTTRQERRAAALKFKNFPLYNAPKELLSSFSYNLPFLWLALAFPNYAPVGLFGLALTLTFRPTNLINNVFEKLLYVRVAERVREQRPVYRDLRRFLLMLNAVSLPLFALLFLVAEPLMTWLFGSRWEGIGYFVRCLVPWVAVALSTTSLSFLANVFGRQREEFFFFVALLLLRASSVVYGVVYHDFEGSILLFSLSGCLVSLALLAWYLGLTRKYEREEKKSSPLK